MSAAKNASLRVPLFICSSFILLTPDLAASASLSWSGASGNSWSNPNNWLPAGSIPSSGDSVLIDQTSQTVMVNTGAAAADLIVGYDGAGAVSVMDRLETTSAVLGANVDAVGTIELVGSDAIWDNDGTLIVGDAGTGSLALVSGSQYIGTGAIYLGYDATGNGSLTVSGTSSLSNTGNIFIGYEGRGTFELTAGGTSVAGDATLGYALGSTGSASISGSGSAWIIDGDLTIGADGTGTLTVSTGGSLSSDSATIGLGGAVGTGSVTLSGLGSAWDNSGLLTVGAGSDGALSVYSAATVSSGSAIIGLHSTGLVTVGGSGSLWTTGALLVGGDRTDTIGADGSGTLDISTGGHVVSDAAIVGDAEDAAGFVTVDGTGSAWDLATGLTLGGLGSGNVTISGGATVTAAEAWLGEGSNSTGSAVVTGTGSLLDIGGDFFAGVDGVASLKVLAGGSVSTGDAYLGSNAGGDGRVLISGSGSSWDVDGDLVVGDAAGASGTVAISAAGSLTSTNGFLGRLVDSEGSVVVTGSGSVWNNSSLLIIGDAGTGALDVILGATVDTTSSIVGNAAGSAGSVNVTGAGSTWQTSADLTVGNSGDATVTVADGGVLSADALYIAAQGGSTGTVNVGAALGQTAAGAATLDVDAIHFGSGDGALVFNFGGDVQTLGADIDGDGSIYVAAGDVVFTGDSAGFAGATTVSGGSLLVDGTLGGSLSVRGYGLLGGTGTVGSTVVDAGGTISPGDGGIGTLTIDGDLTLESGSTYLYEASASSSDLISVTGSVTLNGGTLSLLGAGLQAFTSYELFSATGNVSGVFDSVLSDYAFVDPIIDYASNSASLSLQRNDVAFSEVSTSANQSAAANAVESLGAANVVYDAVAVLDAGEARQAFQQLAGDLHASVSSMTFDNSRFLRDIGIDRLRAIAGNVGGNWQASRSSYTSSALAYGDAVGDRRMPAAVATEAILTDPSTDGARLWGQVYGGWSQADGSAGNYYQTISRTGGFVFGVDAAFPGSDWQLGVLSGYGRSRFTQSSASGTSDDYSVGLYGGNQWGPVALRMGAIYTLHDISTARSVAFGTYSDALSANYRANSAQIYSELAYAFDRNNVRFEPFANVAYVASRTNGFSESGGAAALTGDVERAAVTFATLGARAQGEWQTPLAPAIWHASVGWRHAMGDLDSTSTVAFSGGDAFSVAGTPLESDAAVVDAGIDMKLSQSISLALTYGGAFGSQASSHTVKATLQGRY